MYLDCTPATINRTAIFRIIRDVAKTYHGSFPLLVLGKEISSFSEVEKSSPPSFFKLLVRFPKLGFAVLSTLQFFGFDLYAHKKAVVFFDPLYTLFKKHIDDDIVWVLDCTPITVPNFHNAHVAFLYRRAFSKIANSRCKIVSISSSTTNDLRVNYCIESARIQPIHLYADRLDHHDLEKIADLENKKFFLFVGNLEYRKNLIGLVRAFRNSGLANEGYYLVIIGGQGHGSVEIVNEIESTWGVLWLGFLPDAKREWAYKNCQAFIYPSFWEGFGVPLLEALHAQALCVVSDSGASPEIGRNAVLYCDPHDIASITQGLCAVTRVSSHEKVTLLAHFDAYKDEFSFESFCNDLTKILEQPPGAEGKNEK